MAVEREVLVERVPGAFEGMKISWGGVFGGVLSGVGSLLLLSSLGAAIGITAADPESPGGTGIGIGAAIWAVLTLLISLFIGGWASTRLSMLWEKTTARFEGALVWVLSLILILYLAASGVGLVASGAFSLVGQTAQAAGSAMPQIMDGQGMSSGTVDEMLSRLRDPNTARTLAAATGMQQEEASRELNELAGRVEASRNDPAAAAAEVRRSASGYAARARANLSQTAAEMQPEAATTAWMTFLALVLSLLAAVAGAAVGRRGVVKRAQQP